ncbi:tryptophan synthase subunit beta [Desulfoplanes sp.]
MQSTPKADGFFGEYGGQFLPDSIKDILDQLAATFVSCKDDPGFIQEFESYLKDYSGRPTPLYLCENLTRELGGAKLYLKREDLNHLGAHKINNTIGQILLAKRMGKKKIIAETGAGQHGVATSATAALMGMECTIYMGAEDIKRQRLNVFRMEMLGARVVPAKSGQQTLKEAVDEAIGAWVEDIDNSFYLLGSAVGPHPYPTMVKYFQSVISKETREQIQEKEGRLPDYLVACVGGGSNAIGMFAEFIGDENVKLHGVEPAGKSMNLGDHAASLTTGTPGVLHGFNSYMIKDAEGDAGPVYSIAAGLDYPSVGPEHSFLKDLGRAEYFTASDQDAVNAFFTLSRSEGIVPALESSHALAHAVRLVPTLGKDRIVVVNLSGRGDKDVAQIEEMITAGTIAKPE